MVRPLRSPRRFRLLEVLVAMSILVTLAGMLVPYADRVGERTRDEKARADLATLADNLASFADELQGTPNHERVWWRGPGVLPAGSPPELSESALPLDRLTLPPTVELSDRGPILSVLQPDPWGSAYVIHLTSSAVMSAGPDRVLNTPDDLRETID